MATESNPNRAGVNRRRFLLTSGAVGAGTLAAGLSSWPAVGDPPAPGFSPPQGCGDRNDHDKNRDSLWLDVKDKTPQNPGPHNIAVVQPDPKKNAYYAVHNGDDATKHKYNLLIIPVTRVTGVECPEITRDTFLNLWPLAFKEAQKRFPGVDVIAGINSKDGRTKDQLHIHLTAFFGASRKKLDTLTITSNPNDWNTAIHVLPGSPNPPDPKLPPVPYAYRILHVDNLDFNLFELMRSKIAQSPKNNDMFAQSLAVVTAPKGYYLINTQGNTTQKGQPQHVPDLKADPKSGKVYGTQTVEALFYRG